MSGSATRGDELPRELSTAQGRRGWLREAKRRLDERRAQEARPIPRSRSDRLREAKRRLDEEHRVECQANAAYEAYRARGVMKDGRRFGRPPDPFQPPPVPTGKINLSDLDSRNVKTSRGWVQGYNAQAVCTQDQIVIAAEVTVDSPDLAPMQERQGLRSRAARRLDIVRSERLDGAHAALAFVAEHQHGRHARAPRRSLAASRLRASGSASAGLTTARLLGLVVDSGDEQPAQSGARLDK